MSCVFRSEETPEAGRWFVPIGRIVQTEEGDWIIERWRYVSTVYDLVGSREALRLKDPDDGTFERASW